MTRRGVYASCLLLAGFAKRADYYPMDEPFLGEDAFTRKDFLNLMSGTRRSGETVVLSTHYLEDVARFLDRAIVLHQGEVADDFMLDDIHTKNQTLFTRMSAACGWDPDHYLRFAHPEQNTEE